MKRLIAIMLLIAMCLSIFAGCGEEEKESKQQYDIDAAGEYLLEQFPHSTKKNPVQFTEKLDLPTSFAYKGDDYEVQWSVDVTSGARDAVQIITSAETSQLQLSDGAEGEIRFTIIATITDPDGERSKVRLYYEAEVSLQAPEGIVEPVEFDMSQPVTITFAHTMGKRLQNVLDEHIVEFNKLYPNIHIEHYSAGGWADINGQINTEIAGGSQPNIAYCYPDHVATYNLANAVVPLDYLIESADTVSTTGEIIGLSEEQKNDLIHSFYAGGAVYGDGKMYTMPMSKSTEVMYYNKTFFEENGLSVPTTWDELWTVCEQIKAIDPTCIPLGYDAEDNWFINLCEQMGSGYTSATGDHYLFNNAQNKDMMKTLRDKYQAGLFTTQELYGAYTSGLFTNQDPDSACCYISIASSGGATFQMSNSDTGDGSFAFEVGVAPIPQFDSGNPKTISQGPSLCILRSSVTTDQEIMASWLFIKYLCTNVDFQADFSMYSGYMPVISSVMNNEAYANWLSGANGYKDLVPAVVKNCLENVDAYFVPDAFAGSSTARNQVGYLLVKCLTLASDSEIDTAFDNAIAECEYFG